MFTTDAIAASDQPMKAISSFRQSIDIATTLDDKHNMIALARRGHADLSARHGTLDVA